MPQQAEIWIASLWLAMTTWRGDYAAFARTPSPPRGVIERFKIRNGVEFSVTSPIGRGRIA
jgi:hypothetical protein